MKKHNYSPNVMDKKKREQIVQANQSPQKKEKYVTPRVQAFTIEMENGIANSSAATVKPTNNTNDVTHTWEVAPKRTITIEW